MNTLSIPEPLLVELLVAHRYLGETQQAAYRQYLQTLPIDELAGNPLQLLDKSGIWTPAERSQAILFGEFLQQRWHDILCAHIAIRQGKFNENDLLSGLLLQRAIFLLKKKIVSIAEIWYRQGKWTTDSKEIVQSTQLPDEADEIMQQSSAYMAEEDRQDREWREQCAQGIVGIKYASPTLTPPPSRLENGEETAGSKAEATGQGNQQADAAEEEASHIVTPPPSRLLDYEIDATETLQRPDARKHKHPAPLKYIALATFALAVGLLAFSMSGRRSGDRQLREIEYLLDNKDYVEVQSRCRDFRSSYPQSQHLQKIEQYLQKVLLIQAEIASRQSDWPQTDKVLGELEQMKLDATVARQVQEIRQEWKQTVAREQKQKNFTAHKQLIAEAIRQGDFRSARRTLSAIKNDARDLQLQDVVTRLAQEIAGKERQQQRDLYRFYAANELAQVQDQSHPAPVMPAGVSVALLPLAGKQQMTGFAETQGHFYVTIAGYLYAIKAANGQTAWVEYLGNNALAPVFLAGWREHFNMERVDKLLVAATATNSIRLLQAADGTRIWETAVPGCITSAPAVYKDRLYIGSLDHHCYCFDLVSGRLEGAYRTAGTIGTAPVFDRRSDTLYLCAAGEVHAYTVQSGKLRFTLAAPTAIVQPPLALSPYLCLFTDQEDKTGIHFYQVGASGQPELLQTMTMPGTMQLPATLAGGMVAITTDSHQAIFGLNLANPRELVFALQKPTALAGKGPAHLRFGNLLRRLIVAQEQFTLYRPSEFNDKENALSKIGEWKNSEEWPGGESQPLQQCGTLLLWAQSNEAAHYFQTTCLNVDKDKISLVWQQQMAPAISTEALTTPDQRLLWMTRDGSVHELHNNSQQQLCYRILRAGIGNGDNTPLWIKQGDGEILLAGKELQLLDATTGIEKPWKTPLSIKGKQVQLAAQGNMVFVGTGDGITVLSLADGKKMFEYSEFRAEPFYGKPLCHDNSCWIGCDNGQLYQFQWSNGNPYLQKSWTFQTGGAVRARPLAVKDIICFGSRDGCLYAVHGKSHELIWKFTAGGPIETTPLLYNDALYFGTDDRQLYAVDAATGKLRWQSRFYGKLRATPLLHDDTLYLASIAGDLRAYAVADGRQLWQINLGGPIVSSPVQFAGRIFLGSSNGFLYCVDRK